MAIRFEEGFGGWSGLNSDVGVSDICAELKNEKTYLWNKTFSRCYFWIFKDYHCVPMLFSRFFYWLQQNWDLNL